jgi:4-amino-4-deoxy-L-arabinose transferase-like glycosyltransferase
MAIRTFGLGEQSLWYDEGFSVLLALRNDVPTLFAREAQLNLNTPLYYVAIKLWMAGGGQSEFAVRSLSAFASVVSVALAYRLTAAVLDKPSSIAAALVALSPVSVLAAQEARMYALAGCLCLAATLVLVMALRRSTPTRWVAWGVLGGLAFATHVLCALVVAVQVGVSWVVSWRRRANGAAVGRSQGWVTLAVSALILGCVAAIWPNRAVYGGSYAASADWPALMLQTLAAQVLPRLLPVEWVAPASGIVLVVLILSAIGLLLQRDLGGAPFALVAVAVASVVAVATFCTVIGKFSPRYPTIVTPMLTAFVGIAIAGAIGYVPARAGLAVVVAGLGAMTLALRSHPLYANEDFRAAAAYIRAYLQPDERVVLVSGHFAPVFAYYWTGPRDAWLALPDDPVLNVNNTLTYTDAVPALNRALTGMGGAWLLLWQDDVIDPTGLVTALLRRQAQAFAPQPDTPQFAGLRLLHYRFFRPYQPLPEHIFTDGSTIEHNRAEVGLSSLGCRQPHPVRTGDGFMEVQCFWQTRPFVPLSVYTKVSLRLTDGRGEQVLQSDQPIATNGFPYVPFEKPIFGSYLIPLPDGLHAGDYALRVIPYTESGEISPQVSLPIRVLPK